MGQNKRQEKIRLIAGALLLLFLSYFSNVSLFQHTHVIHGVTIVHSHLHSNHHSDVPSGGHTSNDLTLIASLSHLQWVHVDFLSLREVFQPIVYFQLTTACNFFVSSADLEQAPLRGPPIV